MKKTYGQIVELDQTNGTRHGILILLVRTYSIWRPADGLSVYYCEVQVELNKVSVLMPCVPSANYVNFSQIRHGLL